MTGFVCIVSIFDLAIVDYGMVHQRIGSFDFNCMACVEDCDNVTYECG